MEFLYKLYYGALMALMDEIYWMRQQQARIESRKMSSNQKMNCDSGRRLNLLPAEEPLVYGFFLKYFHSVTFLGKFFSYFHQFFLFPLLLCFFFFLVE